MGVFPRSVGIILRMDANMILREYQALDGRILGQYVVDTASTLSIQMMKMRTTLMKINHTQKSGSILDGMPLVT